MIINTRIFSQNDSSYKWGFDDVLKQVNSFIKEHDIRKEDIIEYRTDHKYHDGYWIWTVTLSYWTTDDDNSDTD